MERLFTILFVVLFLTVTGLLVLKVIRNLESFLRGNIKDVENSDFTSTFFSSRMVTAVFLFTVLVSVYQKWVSSAGMNYPLFATGVLNIIYMSCVGYFCGLFFYRSHKKQEE